MLDAITNEKLTLPEIYSEQWDVDCKSVGTGDKASIYLGRYLYRGVIREEDIIACEVGWGRKHRDLSDIGAIGINEIQWQRG